MPAAKHGKICYIEMPARDAQTSADFYRRAFGWTIRTRGDGAIAFDDTTGEVSGAFVVGRTPMAPGLMVYVMVDSVAEAIEKVTAHGGEIVQPIDGDPGEITARFRDPGGNVIGLSGAGFTNVGCLLRGYALIGSTLSQRPLFGIEQRRSESPTGPGFRT
jgi:hypothetical protein